MLNTFRYRFAHTRLIVFFGLIYAVSQIALGIIIHHLDTLLFLKAQTTFSADVLKDLLTQWDQAGLMPHYRHHFYLDFFHPFWYAMFLAAFLAKAMNLNQLPDKFTPLLLMPVVAACGVLWRLCWSCWSGCLPCMCFCVGMPVRGRCIRPFRCGFFFASV